MFQVVFDHFGAPGSPDTAGEIGDTEEAGPAGAPGLFGVDGAAGLDGAPGTTGVMIVVSRGQSLTWSTWYHCSVDSGVKRAKPHREHLVPLECCSGVKRAKPHS
ncbi:hypothetical protein EMCRGX_G005673 [Ephydatia muelleri]